ncbi:hypothetical protein [Streptomyces sp. NPDC006463]|uniref:hypothetical protein n=1 Tax=Streptomyces sp. NPDC006463 TaxID=3364746 RepID=UPI0036C5C95A
MTPTLEQVSIGQYFTDVRRPADSARTPVCAESGRGHELEVEGLGIVWGIAAHGFAVVGDARR